MSAVTVYVHLGSRDVVRLSGRATVALLDPVPTSAVMLGSRDELHEQRLAVGWGPDTGWILSRRGLVVRGLLEGELS